jgi:hypothetical protein
LPNFSITNHWNSARVVHQPVQVEQALVDHVLVGVPLVLDDHRATVLVQPQRVDATLVGLAGGVLGGEEAHAEEGRHLRLDQGLQVFFDGGGAAGKLHGAGAAQAE